MRKIIFFLTVMATGHQALSQGLVQLVNQNPNCTVSVILIGNSVSSSDPACSIKSKPILLDVYGSGANTYAASDCMGVQSSPGWYSIPSGSFGSPPMDFTWTDAAFVYACPCPVQVQYAGASVGLTTSTCLSTSELLTWSGSPGAGTCTSVSLSVTANIYTITPSTAISIVFN